MTAAALHETVPAAPASTTAPGRSLNRIAYVDALRVVLIMLVVAHHSVEAYVTAHPPEIPLPDSPIARASVFLGVNAAFFMGIFFFLAGCFTPGALDRKGATAFLRDRGRRLGLPLLFGTVAIVPIAGWAHLALDPAAPPISYWTYWTRYFPPQGPLHRYFFGDVSKPGFWPEWEHWPAFNFGHLWFLEHLLVYALLYAAARAFIPADRGSVARNPPTDAAIAVYAVLLAATTFVIRIWYPQDRWIGFLGFIQMEPAHIAQYASLFVIGLLAGPRRWLETMPTRRGLAWLAVGVGLAAATYLWAAVATIRGPDSSSWLMCAWEAFLCVGFCVGLPVLFRELAIGTGRVWRVLAANVFAVYVFHMPIVLLLQWALIGAPGPKWLRLIVTVIGAILVSFAFTNWVILRLPYARRIF